MKLVFRVLAGLVGLVFLLAGGAKLAGQEAMVESFTRFGLPIFFMYFIGAAEVMGAIGLQLTKFAKWAAGGLLLIMIGAVGIHLMFDPAPKAVPAIVIAALLGVLLWNARKTYSVIDASAT